LRPNRPLLINSSLSEGPTKVSSRDKDVPKAAATFQ
jgi:hypothetical protein